MKRLLVLTTVFGLLAATFVVACGGDDDSPNSSDSTPPTVQVPTQNAPVSMTITNFVYSPANFTVRPGSPVVVSIQNNDTVPHTFTIDGVVDSGLINGNASGSSQFTPSQPGTLTFYCTVHGRAAMSGTITVSASALLDVSETDGVRVHGEALPSRASTG